VSLGPREFEEAGSEESRVGNRWKAEHKVQREWEAARKLYQCFLWPHRKSQ